MSKTIGQLIINSPYGEPQQHWKYERESRTFTLMKGRRPAGYVVATPGSKSFDDPGVFKDLPLPNRVRPRVAAWRAANYPGITGVTRRLLEHWRDPELNESRRFFFCQLEAFETLAWLTEADPSERQGIEIPGDGGPFTRLCAKMATGSGKTIVMAMVIAWHVLNRVANDKDPRFSKNVFVVAPGLTVRKRLAVLVPAAPGNYYDQFDLVPAPLRERLRQGCVLVRNWHALNWDSDEQLAKKRSVDKRGAKSDLAYAREVLGEMASASDILVLNDEAHHAWRLTAGTKVAGVSKAEADEATKWIGGLDRIHRSRRILAAYDFSATPFVPSGKQSDEEALFGWIVSDFGLNDAIEAGLVKTPRVVVRDDALPGSKDYKSKLYHIYNWVKADLNRKAEEHDGLPDLVRNAYVLLGADWRATLESWNEQRRDTPPVMITVANRTETAARVKYAFDRGKIPVEELKDPARTLHIDSKVLERAEAREDEEELNLAAPELGPEDGDEEDVAEERLPRRLTKDQQAERLRRIVDTVGRIGEPGADIQHVVSVGMLTEGWDARTVTHIMGLRAFTSQLLCEQVVGRGLRRTSYEVRAEDGLFEPEYVNIFGIPFTFLPHEGGDTDVIPPPPKPKSIIAPDPAKAAFEISWPNIVRIETVLKAHLGLELERLKPLELFATDTVSLAELAPIVEGKPDVSRIKSVDLERLAREFRMQRIAFEVAAEVFDQSQRAWIGRRELLLSQVVGLVETFLASNRIIMFPELFMQDPLRRRVILTLNMNKVVRHIWEAIRFENRAALQPVFDAEKPIRSTVDMVPWGTGRPWENTQRSHINRCVFDSTWEACEAFALEQDPQVRAWAKNDHLGFEIVYIFEGVVRRFRPDFLVRLTNGVMLVLEVKGQDSDQNRTKRRFLDEWVQAVNGHGGFGRWASDVSHHPADVAAILARHAKS